MRASLAVLASGIIPADERDAGAESAGASERIALRIEQGVNARSYTDGLQLAEQIAREQYGKPANQLTASQTYELMRILRERHPAFYKQLRMDVAAAYLGDPEVWKRIGFPGASIESGGYPDFDQPQGRPRVDSRQNVTGGWDR